MGFADTNSTCTDRPRAGLRSAVVGALARAPCRSRRDRRRSSRKKLMKPAPAISTLATAGLAGSARTSASASLRGFWRVALASRMARLLAKSPCCASRVRSTSMLDVARGGGHQVFRQRAERLPQQFFDQGLQGESVGRSTKGRQFTAARPESSQSTSSGSTSIDQRKPGGPGSFSTSGSQSLEKALQRGPRRRSRSGDARESDRRAARSGRSPAPAL